MGDYFIVSAGIMACGYALSIAALHPAAGMGKRDPKKSRFS
jgi:hypothetical protein